MESTHYAGEPQPLVHRHHTGQTETVLTSFTLAQQYRYRLLANQGVLGSTLIMGCIPFITDTDLSSINDFFTLTYKVRFVTSSVLQARTVRVNWSTLSRLIQQLCISHHIPCGDHVCLCTICTMYGCLHSPHMLTGASRDTYYQYFEHWHSTQISLHGHKTGTFHLTSNSSLSHGQNPFRRFVWAQIMV